MGWFYNQYGKTGLLPKKNQNYSTDFKLKVLQSIDDDYLSLSEACLKFNVTSESVIIKWQKILLLLVLQDYNQNLKEDQNR